MPADTKYIGEALRQGGQGFAAMLAEKRKLDAEERDRRHKEFMERLQRQAGSQVNELAKHPDLREGVLRGQDLPTAINTAQERDKAAAIAQAQQQSRQAFESTVMGGMQGPMSPDYTAQQQTFPDLTANEQFDQLGKIAKQRIPPDIEGNATMFGVDPKQLSSLVGQGESVSDALSKIKGWNKSSESGSDEKKWHNDIVIRTRAMELQKTDPEGAERLLSMYGLNLGGERQVDEKALREQYARYTRSYEQDIQDPFRLMMVNNNLVEVEKQLGGPIKTFGEWLETPGAMELNPPLTKKLRDEDNQRMQQIINEWQISKVDGTTPDDFIADLKKADDYKDIMNPAMLSRIRRMLQ